MLAKSCSDHSADLLHPLLNSLQHWTRCVLRRSHAIGGIHPVEPSVHNLFPLLLQLRELILLRDKLCPKFHASGFLLSDESE